MVLRYGNCYLPPKERAISIQRALSPDDSTLSFVEIFRLVQAVRIYPKFLAAVVSFLLLTSKAHRHGSCCLPFILSYNVILILAGKKLHNASSTAPLIEEVAKGCTSSRRRLAPVTNSAEKFFATGPPSVHCQNVHMPEIALYIHNRRILIQRIWEYKNSLNGFICETYLHIAREMYEHRRMAYPALRTAERSSLQLTIRGKPCGCAATEHNLYLQYNSVTKYAIRGRAYTKTANMWLS